MLHYAVSFLIANVEEADVEDDMREKFGQPGEGCDNWADELEELMERLD